MLSGDLQAAIRRTVETALAPIPVLAIDFNEREDFDGNDVIYVTLLLPSGTGPLPPSQYMQAMTDVSSRLLQANDERMPLFRTMREGEPETAEDEAAAS